MLIFFAFFIEQSDDSAMDQEESIGGESFASTSEQKSISSVSPSSMAAPSGSSKCILRQPKLKFHASSSTLNSSNNSDGPFSFSINNSITSNPIGRLYAFIKQEFLETLSTIMSIFLDYSNRFLISWFNSVSSIEVVTTN